MEGQPVLFEFGILRILDCGFAINEQVDIVENEPVNIGYGMNFVYNSSENWVEFVVKAEYRDIKTQAMFISGSTLTRFNVINMSRYLDENKQVIFPETSLETLFGIAFGHMRAILSKNVTGSKYGNIVVPPIDPISLFNDLLKMQIEQLKEMLKKQNETKDQETKV
ncbi:hypothetical protein [uncultured Mucilaginibacter sp.]|uniref:hypothetical protein n=1 Tax=uncultured Mucilaginibacter sp. TaxID=797541 RepID=UPI0025F1E9E1|nr:hypothetical protein [uncultured Mucilaginibacter sp.]